ncbi:MAG: DUF4116 domain-containing protein [Pseudomonadota bacterium]
MGADDPRYDLDSEFALVEVPRRNRFSPLIVFRLDPGDAGRLLYFEPQRRLALNLWRDKAFVLAAVDQDCRALDFADRRLKRDREVVLATVKWDGFIALRHADESLRSDSGVVLAAVKQNGIALAYADKILRRDRDVVLAAIAQDSYALRWADESLRGDRDVVLAAVTQDGCALQHADVSLQNDPVVVAAAAQAPRH